jgi:hypothetical protein
VNPPRRIREWLGEDCGDLSSGGIPQIHSAEVPETKHSGCHSPAGRAVRSPDLAAKYLEGLKDNLRSELWPRKEYRFAGSFDVTHDAADALCPTACRRTGFRPADPYIVVQVLDGETLPLAPLDIGGRPMGSPAGVMGMASPDRNLNEGESASRRGQIEVSVRGGDPILPSIHGGDLPGAGTGVTA